MRIPLELLSNTNYFTGGKVEDFTDQNKPYFLSKLLGSGTTVDGKPAMDAQVAYALSQILGPQAGTAQANYLGDQTGTASLSRVLGVRTQKNDQVKFDKTTKAAETKRKADATRKKNKEGG